MLEIVDHYLTLQLDPTAEHEVVRAAYRALAQKYHPDREGGSGERMIAINQAWYVLGNPDTRASYDKSRTALAPRRTPVARQSADDRDVMPPSHSGNQGSGTILDFGRYAGWTFSEIARQDPDFLRWLARMPIGRAYAGEIERTLAAVRPPEPARQEPARRSRFGRG